MTAIHMKKIRIGLFLLLFGGFGVPTNVLAALNDTCTTAGGASGIITDTAGSGTCTALNTISYGNACMTGYYYNGTSCTTLPAAQGDACSQSGYYSTGTSCVANYSSCQIDANTTGTYTNGTCNAISGSNPNTPNPPSVPGSLGTVANTLNPGDTPGGSQQPMCTNASPFIGGGMFVVSGTVLCYSGAGKNSNIYSYEVNGGGWNGLNLSDVYARNAITSLGTLSSYGGAQLLSPDQKSGMVVADGDVLIASSDANGNTTSVSVTPLQAITSATDGSNTSSVKVEATKVTTSASNGTSTSSITVDANNGISVASSKSSGSGAAVSINGVVTTGATSNQGVLITGSGQNATAYTAQDRLTGTVPTWADVAIQSKSYGLGDLTLGSAIWVTDYGIQIISPQPTTGQTITNNTGGNSSTGTVVNNNGMNSGAGTVTNNTGGNSGTGSANNTIGANTGTGSVTNNFGTGTGVSQNNFGNTNAATTITSQAGSSTMQMSNGLINMTTGSTLATNGIYGESSLIQGRDSAVGSGGMKIYSQAQTIAANTTIANHLANKQYQNQINGNLYVDGNVYINGTLDYVASESATTTVAGSGVGTSILAGASQGTVGSTGIVLKGSNASYTAVDANGKLISTSGVASQSSASMTLTNGYGNTHGLVITENQATLSGGTHSTSLTLDDNGARFSNSQNGDPVKVTGVADGTGDFDAVNVRQLGRGVAMVSALAGMPQVDPGKSFNIAAGVGHYLGHAALSLGGGWRPNDDTVVKVGVSAATDGDAIANGGIGFSW